MMKPKFVKVKKEYVTYINFGKTDKKNVRIVDVGDTITLIITDIKPSQFKNGEKKINQYFCKEYDDEAETQLAFLPPTDLMYQLEKASVIVNDAIEITYLGQKTTKNGKQMKQFELGIEDDSE